VFSHPPRNLLSRVVVAAQNAMFRLRGREFRVFVHPPAAMRDVLTNRGMRPATMSSTTAWHVSTADR
jgi:hypothetical protein